MYYEIIGKDIHLLRDGSDYYIQITSCINAQSYFIPLGVACKIHKNSYSIIDISPFSDHI